MISFSYSLCSLYSIVFIISEYCILIFMNLVPCILILFDIFYLFCFSNNFVTHYHYTFFIIYLNNLHILFLFDQFLCFYLHDFQCYSLFCFTFFVVYFINNFYFILFSVQIWSPVYWNSHTFFMVSCTKSWIIFKKSIVVDTNHVYCMWTYI